MHSSIRLSSILFIAYSFFDLIKTKINQRACLLSYICKSLPFLPTLWSIPLSNANLFLSSFFLLLFLILFINKPQFFQYFTLIKPSTLSLQMFSIVMTLQMHWQLYDALLEVLVWTLKQVAESFFFFNRKDGIPNWTMQLLKVCWIF